MVYFSLYHSVAGQLNAGNLEARKLSHRPTVNLIKRNTVTLLEWQTDIAGRRHSLPCPGICLAKHLLFDSVTIHPNYRWQVLQQLQVHAPVLLNCARFVLVQKYKYQVPSSLLYEKG